MALARRRLKLNVRLAQDTGTGQSNTFVENQQEDIDIEGLRTIVRIQNSGSPTTARASVQVFGLAQSLMNQLSTLGLQYDELPRNTMTISAGDSKQQMSTVYTGSVYAAYFDPNQPNVSMNFELMSYAADAIISAAPTSFVGQTDVATIMSGFARQMAVGFQNDGVNLTLTNPVFFGGVREQAEQCARQAGIEWPIVDSKMIIFPVGGARNTPNIPVIAAPPLGGMIGYPAFTQQGIIVKTLFDPLLSQGSLVRVESQILSGIADAQNVRRLSVVPTSAIPAEWAISKLDMALDSELAGGDWMMIVYAYNPGRPRPVVR